MLCHLNISPYTIDLSCVPEGDATQPSDIKLAEFIFGKWDGYTGSPDQYWIASTQGTPGNNIINGDALLAGFPIYIAQSANGTYLGDEVYFDIDGGDGNDTIIGGANWDVLGGGSGDDVLDGLDSDDEANGDAGNDTINSGDGDDWVDGGSGDDIVAGGNGNDNVVGGTGADNVTGGDGDDNLFGDTDGMGESAVVSLDVDGFYCAPQTVEDGADVMDGGFGNDRMFGQGGDDIMVGYFGDDGMDGGTGNDLIKGRRGDDNITGGAGDDVIRGGGGNDEMNGAEGNDRIRGAAGSDRIAGGKGDDNLTGGTGRDVFVYCDDCGCDGDDFIFDFTTSARARDQVDLTELERLDLIISSETGDDKSAFLELISFGDDGERGTSDDFSIGTIYLESNQDIRRIFGLDSTFGKTENSLVRADTGVIVDLPSDSVIYNGEHVI